MIANELKMGLQYDNLYTSYIHMYSIMFDFMRNWTIVACDDYFKTIVNVPLMQQLCCN
jgi:hypothetical protein